MRVVYCTAVINNPEVVYSSFFRNTASAPFAVLAANNIHGCIYSANDEGMVRGSAEFFEAEDWSDQVVLVL